MHTGRRGSLVCHRSRSACRSNAGVLEVLMGIEGNTWIGGQASDQHLLPAALTGRRSGVRDPQRPPPFASFASSGYRSALAREPTHRLPSPGAVGSPRLRCRAGGGPLAPRSEAIVGRETELGRIARFLDDISEGPSSLVIEGEAGIGKTTLWQAGVEQGLQRGLKVLATRCGESETTLSLAVPGRSPGSLPGRGAAGAAGTARRGDRGRAPARRRRRLDAGPPRDLARNARDASDHLGIGPNYARHRRPPVARSIYGTGARVLRPADPR